MRSFWRSCGVLFLFFCVFQFFDWWISWINLSGGLIGEANPIGRYLYGVGWFAALLLKMVGCVLIFFVLRVMYDGSFNVNLKNNLFGRVDRWMYARRDVFVKGVLWFANIFYAYVVFHNLYLGFLVAASI